LFGGNLLIISYSQSSQLQQQQPQLQQPKLQQQGPSANMTKSLPVSPPSSQQKAFEEANEEPCDGIYLGPGKCM
jgi:hypothetical protein